MTAGRVQPAFQLLQRPEQSVDILPSLWILLPHLLNGGGEWPPIDQPGAVGQGVHHRMDGFMYRKLPLPWGQLVHCICTSPYTMAGRPPARGNITVFSIQACPTFVKMNLGIDCRYAFMYN